MNKLNLSLLTTALIACGYANSAAASSQITLEAPAADKVETVTETYYEDSEGFDYGVSSSEKGWGWGSKLKAEFDILAMQECTTECTTATTATESTVTLTLTMAEAGLETEELSPFNTRVESHIAWDIVRDFNTEVIYKA